MSTKIYDAFHVKDDEATGALVWRLLWQIQDMARANIDLALRAHYLDLVETMDTDDAEYQANWVRARSTNPKLTEQRFRLNRAHGIIQDGYRKDSTSMRRSTYSLDVSVAVYRHNGQFYLRTFVEPISVVGSVLDFVQKMPELEDFHYQNSTDKPDSVSEAEWNHRRDTWNSITMHEGVGRYVLLDILGWHAFYRIDPWFSLMREWLEAPPELPIREEIWARSLRKLKKLRDVEARPGRIEAWVGETRVLIERAAKGCPTCEGRGVFCSGECRGSGLVTRWVSTIGDVTAEHPSLNHAASHVEFEHLPDLMKEMVLRMIERSKPASPPA